MEDKPKEYSKDYMENHVKYYRREYIRRYGEDPFESGSVPSKVPPGFSEYSSPFKLHWNEELGVGVMEYLDTFTGMACLVAKEVTDAENYVRKFGLSFRGDIHWKAAPTLLEHLTRTPVFKAVFVSISKLPFKLAPDIPEKLDGRINWAERNYEMHRDTAETLKERLRGQNLPGGPFPRYLPKQVKEEQRNARAFLGAAATLESHLQAHLKNYFQIKPHLFGAALFFYVYTAPQESSREAAEQIVARRKAAKLEIRETYFIACDEVHDPLVVFNPEVFPLWDRLKQYYGLALAKDVAGFNSDKDVAGVLRKLFTLSLAVPKEEAIDEKIHIPTDEVSRQQPRSAYIGHVVSSVVKRAATRQRVYLPLDLFTGHGVIYGKTRSGKSFLSLLLIQEALKAGIKVKVFDPHGTVVDRLQDSPLVEKHFTRGTADVGKDLQEIYQRASDWTETNRLRLLVVLDETQLLRAKNLPSCLNELGKRGVGFLLITQYATSIPPVARNLGTMFILSEMSDTEVERFRELTLHPSAKLIPRLPKGMSFLFSPAWYPEPFFVMHRWTEDKLGGELRTV